MTKIVERIQKQIGNPNLLDSLSDNCSLSDLQSLLLEVYRRKTEKRLPKEVFDQYKNNRFVRPSKVSVKKTMAFDLLAFSLLPFSFEILELSPLAPLGSCSVLANVDQNNILSTIRNTEVCSDSTNVLALESSLRRQEDKSSSRIHLCSSQKVVRCQDFKMPNCFAPFRLLSLTSAGRDEGSFKFEMEELLEHISYFISLFKKARELGIQTQDLTVCITALDEQRKPSLQKQVIDLLSHKHPGVAIQLDQNRKSGRHYYKDACFQIFAKDISNTTQLLVDGGFTNWTALLLSNEKERFLISGLGSERLLALFQEEKKYSQIIKQNGNV